MIFCYSNCIQIHFRFVSDGLITQTEFSYIKSRDIQYAVIFVASYYLGQGAQFQDLQKRPQGVLKETRHK